MELNLVKIGTEESLIVNMSSKDYSKSISIQPFWESKKVNQKILYDQQNGIPIMSVHEISLSGEVTSLDCVPGVGLVSILFSLTPDDSRAICCGTLNKSKSVPLYGLKHLFCMQFFPGTFTHIFGIPSNLLLNAEYPLFDLLHIGSIAEEFSNSKNFNDRIFLAYNFFKHYESRTNNQVNGQLIQGIMHDILLNHGDIRVSDLEYKTGYSARYLQKIINEYVGIPPKTVLANIRFQTALRTMIEHPTLSIAQIAQQNGYYDQSHFNKVFKSYMGTTPYRFQSSFFKNKLNIYISNDKL